MPSHHKNAIAMDATQRRLRERLGLRTSGYTPTRATMAREGGILTEDCATCGSPNSWAVGADFKIPRDARCSYCGAKRVRMQVATGGTHGR